MTRERVARLLQTPYLGRVEFRRRGDVQPEVHYIGEYTSFDPETRGVRIHDWRSPVSDLLYDFESGATSFATPARTSHGEISGKRQYKNQDGRLEFTLGSSLKVGDDVSQRERGNPPMKE